MDSYQATRHLPADLFPEILSRLPVKSLMRFRCVSKPWLSLVDKDADFAQLHLKNFRNNRDETCLFVKRSSSSEFPMECEVWSTDTLEPIPEILPLSELEYCATHYATDGLILLNYGHIRDGCFYELKLWNPSIGKIHVIPPLLKPILSPSSFLKELNIGMGYDPIAKDYKLVKIIVVGNKVLHSVAIYDLGVDSWRNIRFEGFDWEPYMLDEPVYSRSRFYFVAWTGRGDSNLEVVWFDLSNEVFSSVRMPDHPMICPSRHWVRLVTIDGELALQVVDRSSGKLWVAVLDEDSEFMCWAKPYSCCLEKHHGIILYLEKYHDTIRIKKNGDWLLKRTHLKTEVDERGKKILVPRHEVKFYSRERKEQANCLPSQISYHVESLILHK